MLTVVSQTAVNIINQVCAAVLPLRKRVQAALGNPMIMHGSEPREKYNQEWHRKCWIHFNVRPPSSSAYPEQADSRYCIYDARHEDYSYIEDWVNLLIEKFRDDKLYEELYPPEWGGYGFG